MRNKILKRIFLLILSAFIAFGGIQVINHFGKPSQFEYFAQNNCESKVTIQFTDSHNNRQSINIEPKATISLSSYNFIDFKESKIDNVLKNIHLICNNDTSIINYSDINLWEYSQKNKIGVYLLKINQLYFRK